MRAVHERLGADRSVGYTGVLKLLQNMHAKGMVNRNQDGQAHIYEAREPTRMKRQLLGELMSGCSPDRPASWCCTCWKTAKPSQGNRRNPPDAGGPPQEVEMTELFSLLTFQAGRELGWTLIHFLWQGACWPPCCRLCIPYAAARAARHNWALATVALMALAPAATFAVLHDFAAGSGDPGTALPTASGAWMDWLVIAWFAGVAMLSLRAMGGWMWRTRCAAAIRWRSRPRFCSAAASCNAAWG